METLEAHALVGGETDGIGIGGQTELLLIEQPAQGKAGPLMRQAYLIPEHLLDLRICGRRGQRDAAGKHPPQHDLRGGERLAATVAALDGHARPWLRDGVQNAPRHLPRVMPQDLRDKPLRVIGQAPRHGACVSRRDGRR
jgi:hypothetical protein